MPKRKQRIVRNLPADVAEALERERKRKGASLNQTVVDTLRRGLGLEQQRKSNGLGALAGGWSEEEFKEFEEAVREFEQIDEERWR